MCQAGQVESVGVVILGLDGSAVGIVLLVLAAVLLAVSNGWLAKANPSDLLPTGWGNPPAAPLGALALRGAGAGLAVLGVVLLAPGVGWTVVLILAVFVPYGAINVVHNQRVRNRTDPSGR